MAQVVAYGDELGTTAERMGCVGVAQPVGESSPKWGLGRHAHGIYDCPAIMAWLWLSQRESKHSGMQVPVEIVNPHLRQQVRAFI